MQELSKSATGSCGRAESGPDGRPLYDTGTSVTPADSGIGAAALTRPLRILDLMRRMPELRRLDARLSDPDWHPTAEDLAEAQKALAKHRADRQAVLALTVPKEPRV